MPVSVRTLSAETQVNTNSAGLQFSPDRIVQADGSSMLVWLGGYGESISAQFYGADGAPIGAEISVAASGLQLRLPVATCALADGGYAVAWHTDDNSDLIQYFNASGSPKGAPIRCSLPSDVDSQWSYYTITLLPSGGYAVEYIVYSTTPGSPIFNNESRPHIQFFSTTGMPVSGVMEVMTPLSFSSVPYSAEILADGRVLAWFEGYDNSTNLRGIMAQFFTQNGGPIGESFVLDIADGIGGNSFYSVPIGFSSLSDGGFAVLYRNTEAFPVDSGMRVQRFDALGQAVGSAFSVTGEGILTELEDGSFVLIGIGLGEFGYNEFLHADFYNSEGVPLGQPAIVNSAPNAPSTWVRSFDIAELPGGGATITWTEQAWYGSSTEIFQTTLSTPSTLDTLTTTNEIVTGTPGDDLILSRNGGVNVGDSIGGGAGTDTIRLTEAGTIDAASVTLTSIEILEGSEGDDLIMVNAAALASGMQMEGRGGNDRLHIVNASVPTAFDPTQHGFEAATRELTDTNNNQSYRIINETYDLSWRLLEAVRQNDNGTSVNTVYDYTSAVNYSSLVQEYSATNQRTAQRTYFDAGGYQFYYYDPTNAQTWREFSDDYDASGQRTRERIYNDNSSYRFFYWDTANTQNWRTFDDEFNASGARHTERITYDDGTTRLFYWDVTSTQTWTTFDDSYTAGGQRAIQRIQNDDGTSSQQFWDTNNSQDYSSYIDYFNAAGQRVEERIFHDRGGNAGGHTRIYYDPANAYSWSTQTDIYNAAGVLISSSQAAD